MENNLIRRVVENSWERIDDTVTVVEKLISDTHDSLWEQFSSGLISRKDYQQRTERLIDSNRTKSTGCGYICIVDELTLKVSRTIEGTL